MELNPDAAMILDTVMDDVVIVDITFKELTFIVEYPATPGGPLLTLDTVMVDRDNMLEVIDDPVRDEKVIDDAAIVDPVRVDKERADVVMEAVEMDDPWMVLTVMARAATFRRPR